MPAAPDPTPTADLLDVHGDAAAVCTLELPSYGGARAFWGEIATVRCHEDNVLVRRQVSSPGAGRVLVVDGGGSRRRALVGDNIATIARDNGWAGIVVNGAVRDAATLAAVAIGVRALATHPWASRKDGTGEVDVPVTFGGVTFRPGAFIAADDDGVVVLASRPPG